MENLEISIEFRENNEVVFHLFKVLLIPVILQELFNILHFKCDDKDKEYY